MKKLSLVIVASFFLIQEIKSQDPKFLNSNQSLLFVNPSFAGSNGGFRSQLSYQRQWPENRYGFVTYQAAVDAYLPGIKAGIGLSTSTDIFSAGVYKTTYYNFIYAQHLKLCEHLVIIPSIRISYFQKYVDVTSLHFGDPIDPRTGEPWPGPAIPSSRKQNADFSAGGLINLRKDFYFGVYYFHLMEPDEGLLGSNKLHGQLAFYGSYNHKLSPSSLMQITVRVEGQNDYWYNQINLNAVLYKYLVVGIGATSFEAGTLNLGCRFDRFNVVGSYNLLYSKLSGQAESIWEVNSALTIRTKEKRHELVNFENW